jgi:hypothetical protein
VAAQRRRRRQHESDLVKLLKARIEAAGFVVLPMHIAEIRAGLDLGSYARQVPARFLARSDRKAVGQYSIVRRQGPASVPGADGG